MTLDFNRSRAPADYVRQLLDESMVAAASHESHRSYIGASAIGEACARRIQYELFDTPRDPGRERSAANLRLCQRGHLFEPVMADWLRQAGFTLQTTDEHGQQFGFSMAGGRIQGHIDGIITAGPDSFAYPCLWENKALSSKAWKLLAKSRLAIAKPIYAAQVALYQAYLGLYAHPALFTALNADIDDRLTTAAPPAAVDAFSARRNATVSR